MEKKLFIMIFALAAGILGAIGCDENSYLGELAENRSPTIKLTSGPLEGDTTTYRIKFSWIGNDPDGAVKSYEYVICEGNPIGFDPADTTGLDKWTKIVRQDSTFSFTADEYEKDVKIGGSYYSWFRRTLTFFIRAVDDRGGRSDAAYRSFTARTLAPYAVIEAPRNPFPGQSQMVPPVVRFQWRSEDPIDDPWNRQEADSVRYLMIPNLKETLNELNRNPGQFEDQWKPWRSVHAPGDSGTSTMIGDDELLSKLSTYVFAVQAKDEAGAVTAIFDTKVNARVFAVLLNAGPLLKVSEPYLGAYSYVGPNNRAETFKLPAGFSVNFQWAADAGSYGGIISSYRYGWDVTDFNDPNDWDAQPSPFLLSIPPTTFNSGVHTLTIEAVDNNGISTIAQMELTFFPLAMDRNLLWVDDFYSTDFYQTVYAFPTESDHDDFWVNICSRSVGFSAGRDVFEVASHNNLPPDIELLWRYKNIIWTYSSDDRVNAWDDMVRFIPESWIGRYSRLSFNFLSSYLASGGHIWTEGKSDRQGGLCAVLFAQNPFVQMFPVNLRCEITGSRTGCDGDTSGVRSMAYQDYCVSVLDKVSPTLRRDDRLPVRRIDWDAMSWAYRDTRDAVTTAHEGLPTRLKLWDMVTKPGNFFDPRVQGFTYVELYDPGYWMSLTGIRGQSCFHPMFRMRTRSSLSHVDNTIVAFWTTKYADVVPKVEGGVGAPSVHFGMPLYFFNRAQVDSLTDVIFKEWRISAR